MIRYVIAWALWWLGDLTSKAVLRWGWFFLYDLYCWFMVMSCKIDHAGKCGVWRPGKKANLVNSDWYGHTFVSYRERRHRWITENHRYHAGNIFSA